MAGRNRAPGKAQEQSKRREANDNSRNLRLRGILGRQSDAGVNHPESCGYWKYASGKNGWY